MNATRFHFRSSVSEATVSACSESSQDTSQTTRKTAIPTAPDTHYHGGLQSSSSESTRSSLIIPDREKLAGLLGVDRERGHLPGITEGEFRDLAKRLGLPHDLCEALITDVKDAVSALTSLSDDEQVLINAKLSEIKGFGALPVDRSRRRQAATVCTAGAAAYLTSFFFGKLALNLSVAATGSPHAGWAFLIAGLLNPTVSEPLVNGIRGSGACYSSPDGKAMSECFSAELWCSLAKSSGDKTTQLRHRKVIAEHVVALIEREKKHTITRLGSGVAEIIYDNDHEPVSAKAINGHPIDPKNAESKVLRCARTRAFITDELPFFWFTVNYAVSGAVSAMLRPVLTPWTYCGVDMVISAISGTAAAMQTAATQNMLRQAIQGATLVAEPVEVKRARLSHAQANISAYASKAGRLGQVIQLLETVRQELSEQARGGAQVDEQLAELADRLSLARQAKKDVERQYEKNKQRYNQHASLLARTHQSIGASMSAYLGEVGVRPSPATHSAAQLRAWTKLPAYMASLIPVIVYASYAAPALVQWIHPAPSGNSTHASSMPGWNSTGAEFVADLDTRDVTPPDNDAAKQTTQVIFSALQGVPLILGYVMRNQVLAQGIERSSVLAAKGWQWLTSTLAQSNVADGDGHVDDDDDESIISVSSDGQESDKDDHVIDVAGLMDQSALRGGTEQTDMNEDGVNSQDHRNGRRADRDESLKLPLPESSSDS